MLNAIKLVFLMLYAKIFKTLNVNALRLVLKSSHRPVATPKMFSRAVIKKLKLYKIDLIKEELEYIHITK